MTRTSASPAPASSHPSHRGTLAALASISFWFSACSTMPARLTLELPPQVRVEGARDFSLERVRVEGEWEPLPAKRSRDLGATIVREALGAMELHALADLAHGEVRDAVQDAVLEQGWYRLKDHDADLRLRLRLGFEGRDAWERVAEVSEAEDTAWTWHACRSASAKLRGEFLGPSGTVAATFNLERNGPKHCAEGFHPGSLPSKRGVVEALIPPLAREAAALIAPSRITVERRLFRKGSRGLERAAKSVKKGNWERAETAWRQELDHEDVKVRQRAAVNLGIAKERRGDLAGALDLLSRYRSGPEEKAVTALSKGIRFRIQQEAELERWHAGRR